MDVLAYGREIAAFILVVFVVFVVFTVSVVFGMA
jgi:hypothetical protein